MSNSKSDETSKRELQLNTALNYGINLRDRIITLCPDSEDHEDDSQHEIKPDSFVRLDVALSELESLSKKTITIRIHSWGGCVKTAMAMVGRIKTSKCKIITEGYGTIESAATLILACGDERRISKFCTFMWHEMSLSTSGRLSTAESDLKQARIEEKMWAKWMSEFSHKPLKFYMDQGKYTDVWWTPDELLKFGVIDKII